MPPVPVLLLIVALIFLVVHVARAGFPLWPSVLCILVRLLAFSLAFLWTAPLLAQDPRVEILEPVGREEVLCFSKAQTPEPCPTFRLSLRAGGGFGAATDVEATAEPTFLIRTYSQLTRARGGPWLQVQAALRALPDEDRAELETTVFKSLEASGTVVQPLGETLLFSLYGRVGAATRLATTREPSARLPGFLSIGLDFHTHDRDNYLQVGIGPDQRLSGDWAQTVTAEGAVKIRQVGEVKVWLEVQVIRALDLSRYGVRPPSRDWWTAGVTVGF